MNLHILQRMVTVVALTCGVIKILRPNKSRMSRRWYHRWNVLSFRTSNLEFSSFKCTLAWKNIINIDLPIVVLSWEFCCILPSKQIKWRLARVCRVKWARVQPVKLSVEHGRSNAFFLSLSCFLSKLSFNDSKGFLEVAVFVNLNLIYFFWAGLWHQIKAELFICTELQSFQGIGWIFATFKFCKSLTSTCGKDKQVGLRFLVVKLFATYNIVVTGRPLECLNV